MISKVASGPVWTAAEKALNEFNRHYERFYKLEKQLDSGSLGSQEKTLDAMDTLLGKFAFRRDNTVPTQEGPFREWMREAFMKGEVNPNDVRPDGRMILDVIDGKRDLDEFKKALEIYRDALERVVQAQGPESFSYQGFRILNQDRLGERVLRTMLDSVDFVVALFKKRGVTPLLKETVSVINILPRESMYTLSQTASGLYHIRQKTISLSTRILREGSGRFMENWVHEVLLHEIGHHLHLHLLPKPAKQVWDAAWGPIQEKKLELKAISETEVAKFFDLLVFTKFNLKAAIKKLRDPMQKIKFGLWLRNPMVGDSLITPKQLRWTSSGKYLVSFYTDRERFMKKNYGVEPTDSDYQEKVERVDGRLKDKLGFGMGRIPILQDIQELSKSDPIFTKAVKEVLDKLDIVSDYGKTDEMEDFAETFVTFMAAPSKLTPTAKFRMQQALSIANLYNKTVMKLADQFLAETVVERYLNDRN